MKPRVSVVMAVYNGERYLREAIESVLAQTFTDFEFIIIDDGSTDASVSVINSYDDPRIRLLRNASNTGLTASLNKGLDAARGDYIARMDADDVCLPARLARQVAFMDAHTEVAASGTWAKDIDGEGRITTLRRAPVGQQLEDEFWRLSPIIHPSAMIRAAHLGELRYDPNVRYAQDFDLWLRLRVEYQLSNVPEYLLLYRVHGESITTTKTDSQIRSAHEILCRRTGLEISYETFLALLGLSRELNPLRRALAMRHTARTLSRPYRRFVRSDIHYAGEWLRARMPRERLRVRLLRALYSVWQRVKPHAF